ncbi:cytochrome protein [Aspergillus coremiiformis]|uniref:Cytochrome protein n=1 Tax=Aspergillus coremiiformis TaxID=138285 RepID=A0A5N6ZC10_9EURO|nr:cytochrome protein [Aspergillus coremiiformis]
MLALPEWSLAASLLLGSLLVLHVLSKNHPLRRYPLVNGRALTEIFDSKAKQRFVDHAQSLIDAGFKHSSQGFRLHTDFGTKLVLPPKYAEEIALDGRFSFGKSIDREFFVDYAGFEPFRSGPEHNGLFLDTIKSKMTNAGLIMRPLSEETELTLREQWTDSPEWHTLPLYTNVVRIIAQLTSRIFLGQELCRSAAWLEITSIYPVVGFEAAKELRLWPRPLRPLVVWFLPSCQRLRAQVQRARDVMGPVLDAREAARTNGCAPDQLDAIEWLEEKAKGRPYDPAIAQLTLSLAAVHTTADLLAKVLLDLCEHAEIIPALRQEIVAVIQEHGWQKSTLVNLKLMDSFLKENQRLKPFSLIPMERDAEHSVRLRDGTEIPKGTTLTVANHHLRDPAIYPDPERFDPYRFLKLRDEKGQERTAQLESTSPDHLGFGYGKYACPGRFFASSEVKIALCHILLKYDLQLVGNTTPRVGMHGFFIEVDPAVQFAVRRRAEEIQIPVA